MSKPINITCESAHSLPLGEIKELQGELKYINPKNLKKLKEQIKKHGFSVPFFIAEVGGENLLLDGHQRKRALEELSNDGYAIPERLPAVRIIAANIEEAKEKLLAITSQYGTIKEDGLLDFAADLEIDLGDAINFDAFSIDKVLANLEKEGAIEVDDLEETQHNEDVEKPEKPERTREETVTCPACQHQFQL